MERKDKEIKELLSNLNSEENIDKMVRMLFNTEIRVLYLMYGDSYELSKLDHGEDDVDYTKLKIGHVSIKGIKDNCNYFAVFTDIKELDPAYFCEYCDGGIIYTRRSNMVEASCIYAFMKDLMKDDLKGFVVNPYSDNLVLDSDAIYELGKKSYDYLDDYTKETVNLEFNDRY